MNPSALRRYCVPVACILLIAPLLAAGPIAQLDNYHAFADTRALLHLPHGADVLSNLGFVLVGLYGLCLPGRRDKAYALFCAALVATAAGSSWYHLAPDDARLFWDRLPIAMACAAVLARALGGHLLSLSAFGAASVAWWSWNGDLRAYLLLQALPLVAVPLLQWAQDAPPRERRLFGLAVVLYVLAKACELADHRIYAITDVVSGHTLKHLLATLAALVLARLWGCPAAAGQRQSGHQT